MATSSTATVPSAETSIFGPVVSSGANSRLPWVLPASWTSAALTAAASPAGACTTTRWVVPLLGYAAVSRSYACMAGVVRGRSSVPGNFSFMPSAGAASASRARTLTSRVAAGRRNAGERIVRQARPGSTPLRRAVSRHRNGTRGRSTQRPSLASRAGSTVSEPITATATTRIEPMASDEKVESPARNSPAIAMITAVPETTTAWPEVSAAISTASTWPRPRARSSRSRRT